MPSELLVAIDSLEQLTYAQAYGADAISLNPAAFSLQAGAGLGWQELELALQLCRHFGLKAYVVLDIYPHDLLLESLADGLRRLIPWPPDALVISDPGLLALAREILPGTPLHLSAQARVTNWQSAQFWLSQGIRRIHVPADVSWQNLQALQQRLPEAEFEIQVHGALPLAYSPYSLVHQAAGSSCSSGGCSSKSKPPPEDDRPFRLEENQHGTRLLHRQDLCLLTYLPDLLRTNVVALRCEAVQRDLFYLAMVTHAYRTSIDAWQAAPVQADTLPMLRELMSLGHSLTPGLFAHEDSRLENPAESPVPFYRYVGRVCELQPLPSGSHLAVIEASAHLKQGDLIEFIHRRGAFTKPLGPFEKFDGEVVSSVEPGHYFNLALPESADAFTILRQPQQSLDDEAVAEQYMALVAM